MNPTAQDHKELLQAFNELIKENRELRRELSYVRDICITILEQQHNTQHYFNRMVVALQGGRKLPKKPKIATEPPNKPKIPPLPRYRRKNGLDPPDIPVFRD